MSFLLIRKMITGQSPLKIKINTIELRYCEVIKGSLGFTIATQTLFFLPTFFSLKFVCKQSIFRISMWRTNKNIGRSVIELNCKTDSGHHFKDNFETFPNSMTERVNISLDFQFI